MSDAGAGVQPFLHDLSTCLHAPTVAFSAADGQIRPAGAQGVFSADLRVLSRAEVVVAGCRLEPVSSSAAGAGRADFLAILRPLGDSGPDPTVWLRRRRTVRADGMDERLTVVNVSGQDITAELALLVAADLADIEAVKAGRTHRPKVARWVDGSMVVCSEQVTVTVTAAGAPAETAAGAPAETAAGAPAETAAGTPAENADGPPAFRWRLTVPARRQCSVDWSVSVVDQGPAVISPPSVGGRRGWAGLEVWADDRRVRPFVSRSIADLLALRMTTPARPSDVFLAAGSPWYLTLFGRDSLWAARMTLPLGLGTAVGTLRTLASRQGRARDPLTAEEPGKILHEIRRPATDLENLMLPPVYYGTVDATPLWVCLLADAWRWGLPEDQVLELLPAAERALAWMIECGDSDGDGFLEYIDASGRGLANQGWKDSGDSVRFADGRIATGPVALAEVQGYAYQAAMAGADLLDAFGRPGAVTWRHYAAELSRRFRESFWAVDDLGRYPVLALDGAKQQVDSPASNMGHLLATGILNRPEAELVADRVVHPSMSSGFGLRTMSTTTGGYSPLSYHCGSVWPHDTAIAVDGLVRAGFPVQAAVLAAGVLAAGDAFGGRLPELYGGFASTDSTVPVPYPASCRPQAWSAASAIVLVQALLGLAVNVPAGTLTLDPNPLAGALSVRGLRVAGHDLDVQVGADGKIVELRYSGPLAVVTG